MFSYLFIAAYLYLLIDFEEHPEKKRIFWLIPLQLLWVNLHVFFSIGIMLVGGFLLEKIIQNFKNLKKSVIVKKLAIVLLGVIVISFVNPNGYKGVFYRYPSNFPLKISENQSISEFEQTIAPGEDITVSIIRPLIFFLALSLFFGWRRKPKPIFYSLAGLGTAVLCFFILRGMVFFGLMFLPIVSANFNDLFIRTRDRIRMRSPKIEQRLGQVLSAGLIIVFLFFIYLGSKKVISPERVMGIGLTPRSESAAEFFIDEHLHGPIFNDADSGSYLIYYLYPKEKVFSDNLFGDAYSASFFSDTYLPMLDKEEKWQEELAKYNFNAIVMYQYDGGENIRKFLYTRMRDKEWAFVYVDTYDMIFLRNTPENQEVIQQFKITPENAAEKLSFLTKSPDFDDQVTAADVFNLIGREDLGAQTFLNIVAKWPDKGKVWMVMGEWELRHATVQSSALARMYLEKAISLKHNSAEAYSFLGAAYLNLGQRDNAEEALRHALQINPERQDAKTLFYNMQQFTLQ